MRPRVRAILVAADDVDFLQTTLGALADQTRPADEIVVADPGLSQATERLVDRVLERVGGRRVPVPHGAGFGAAVGIAAAALADPLEADDWLWLLAADSAPADDALQALLEAVELAPSVAVAGPKQLQWDEPAFLAAFGESMTGFGTAVELAEPELDQAQYDRETDVLGVAAGGMLVRGAVWTSLDGFDPALPAFDDALDLCVRARLAGHRVARVPAARVRSAGTAAPGTAVLGRSSSRGRRMRLERTAQLHRRLVYAAAAVVPLHWLSLLPLAVVRAVGQLVRKRPGSVLSELVAALHVAVVGVPGVVRSRRRLRRNRSVGWEAVDPLRIGWQQVRSRRALAREQLLAGRRAGHRIRFVMGGGLWVGLVLLAIGAAAFSPLIGSPAVVGGGALPLGGLDALWGATLLDVRQVGAGYLGAADPFALGLALLGSATFWEPSTGIVLLYVLALPVSGVAAWLAAAHLTERGVARTVAAVAWALAPPLLVALGDGRIGAIVAHMLLPFLVASGWRAARSWAASATSALIGAAIAAAAPSLAPLLLLALAVQVAAAVVRRRRGVHRLLAIPIPAAALFAPLAVQQILLGRPLALLADPGVVLAPVPLAGGGPLDVLRSLLGYPDGSTGGWEVVASALGAADRVDETLVVGILVAPVLLLALVAPFLRGRRALAPLALTVAGLGTAAVLRLVAVQTSGAELVPVWPGAAVSVAWAGLVGAAALTLAVAPPVVLPGTPQTEVTAVLRRSVRRAAASTGAAVAAVALLAAAALPALAGVAAGTSRVAPSDGVMLPALVAAEAEADPQLGTLVLTAASDGGIVPRLVRGATATLEQESTLASTAGAGGPAGSGLPLATLVGNLASRSGYDAGPDLARDGIGFILLRPAADDDAAGSIAARAESALDNNGLLAPVSDTEEGRLWRVVAYDPALPFALPEAGPVDALLRTIVLTSQLLILGMTLILALPTGGLAELMRPERAPRVRRRRAADEDPGDEDTGAVELDAVRVMLAARDEQARDLVAAGTRGGADG